MARRPLAWLTSISYFSLVPSLTLPLGPLARHSTFIPPTRVWLYRVIHFFPFLLLLLEKETQEEKGKASRDERPAQPSCVWRASLSPPPLCHLRQRDRSCDVTGRRKREIIQLTIRKSRGQRPLPEIVRPRLCESYWESQSHYLVPDYPYWCHDDCAGANRRHPRDLEMISRHLAFVYTHTTGLDSGSTSHHFQAWAAWECKSCCLQLFLKQRTGMVNRMNKWKAGI